MLNGDSHVYQAGNPFATSDIHPGYSVPKFQRIVVQGSPPVDTDPTHPDTRNPLEYLRLTIEPGTDAPATSSTFGPFRWERCTADGCVVP